MKVGEIRALAIVVVAWLVFRSSKKGTATMVVSASVQRWETPLLEAGSDGVAPLSFLLGWLRVESGGRNGAVGTPTAEGGPLDAQGFPWEVGIFQLDPGNRANAGGVTAAELRPNCPNQTGTRAQVEFEARPLTADEARVQVVSGLKYVQWCRGIVDQALKAVGANVDPASEWGFGGGMTPSYLRAVKSVHGGPWVMTTGLPYVAKRLGRAPRNWNELAQMLRSSPPAGSPRSLGKILLNAEETVPS